MKAGEYVSASGMQHGFWIDDGLVVNCHGTVCAETDLRPAAAALLALADELETEYVRLGTPTAPWARIVLCPGKEPSLEIEKVDGWGATPSAFPPDDPNRPNIAAMERIALAAFRAGQERGQR